MDTKYNLNEFVNVRTKQNVMINLRDRFIKRCKEQKTTQKGLSDLSGVSYASIRRFEKTCEISLSSLLKLAEAVNCLEDFDNLFCNQIIKNLKDYTQAESKSKRIAAYEELKQRLQNQKSQIAV